MRILPLPFSFTRLIQSRYLSTKGKFLAPGGHRLEHDLLRQPTAGRRGCERAGEHQTDQWMGTSCRLHDALPARRSTGAWPTFPFRCGKRVLSQALARVLETKNPGFASLSTRPRRSSIRPCLSPCRRVPLGPAEAFVEAGGEAAAKLLAELVPTCYPVCMTKTAKQLLERVASWPDEDIERLKLRRAKLRRCATGNITPPTMSCVQSMKPSPSSTGAMLRARRRLERPTRNFAAHEGRLFATGDPRP